MFDRSREWHESVICSDLQTIITRQFSKSPSGFSILIIVNTFHPLTRTWELRKLSCRLSLVNSHQLWCNSCSRLTRTWELRKLSYNRSLLNSHQLSCNSCSRLTRTWELRRPSYDLSLLNSHQLSCNSCSRLYWCKISFDRGIEFRKLYQLWNLSFLNSDLRLLWGYSYLMQYPSQNAPKNRD